MDYIKLEAIQANFITAFKALNSMKLVVRLDFSSMKIWASVIGQIMLQSYQLKILQNVSMGSMG